MVKTVFDPPEFIICRRQTFYTNPNSDITYLLDQTYYLFGEIAVGTDNDPPGFGL